MIIGHILEKELYYFEEICSFTSIKVENAAKIGKFKILYFHHLVKGKNNRGDELIKRICRMMSDSMREKLEMILIVHPTFSLKLSLVFYRGPFSKQYNIHTTRNLNKLNKFLSDKEVRLVEERTEYKKME